MCKIIHTLTLVQLLCTLSAYAASYNCSKPPNFANYDINNCCRSPDINLGAAPEKCDKYISSLKGADIDNYPAYTHMCYPECIYSETGSLVDGEIQMEKVKKFLHASVHSHDKEVVPNIISAFEVCLANIKTQMHSAGMEMYDKLAEGCSPYSSMVYGCVNAETFLHCPPQMWKNDHSCNLAKSFAEQCNPLPHVPLPVV